MKRSYFLWLLLFSLNVSAQINEGDLITKNGYYEIPYNDTKTEIHTNATIKSETYDFIMDSGAPTFISSDIQKKYKFTTILHTTTEDAGGKTLEITIVKIDTLRFGPFVFTGIPALVFDLKHSALECNSLAGNIGSNALRHLIVQFDVQANNIALTDNDKLLKRSIPTHQRMRVDGQSDVYFPVRINDGLTDTVHFDTGDGQLYEISKRESKKYVSKYPGDIVRRGYGTISMGIVGLGASFPQFVMKPENIRIDNDNITGGVVYIAGNDKSRMGRELLNYGILKLDYPDSMFAFEQYDAKYVSGNYDYGFCPVMDDKKVIAGCVWEHTQAAEKGMKSGNEIIKINGADFTLLPKCAIEDSLRKELHQKSESITITFKDKKGSIQTVTLDKKLL